MTRPPPRSTRTHTPVPYPTLFRASRSFVSQMFGDQLKPDIAESSAVLAEEIQQAMKGDLSLASRIFTSQAISLVALFTDMARRSGNNMGHYLDAADRYMRPALKAQAPFRSTL